jgi:hypothetical protein
LKFHDSSLSVLDESHFKALGLQYKKPIFGARIQFEWRGPQGSCVYRELAGLKANRDRYAVGVILAGI